MDNASPGAERFISRSLASVPASGIRKFFDLLSTIDDVISLGVGEPDYVTPEPIRRAALESRHLERRCDPRRCRLPGTLLRRMGGAALTLTHVRARLARLTPAEGARLCAPAL